MSNSRGAFRLLELAVSCLLAMFLARAIFLVASPYPTDDAEGDCWAHGYWLASTGSYFHPPESSPFIRADVPPLFPQLLAALGGTLRAGRLLGLFGTLLAAGSLFVILELAGVERRRAVLWAVLLLGTPSVHEWGAEARPETLALGLSLLGVAVAMRPGGELPAAPIMAAATFVQLSSIAAPLAVAIALRRSGQNSRAWTFTIVYVVLVSLPMVVLHWRSNGALGHHLIGYGMVGGFDVAGLSRWSLQFVFTFPVLLAVGGMLAAEGSGAPSLARVYAGLALLSVIRASVAEASSSALLEASAGVILAAALAVESRLVARSASAERQRALALLLVVQVVLICDPGRPLELRDLMRELRVREAAVVALSAAPGPVLADDAGLALAAGHRPIGAPDQIRRLTGSAKLDSAPFLASVVDRAYGAILVGPRLRAIKGFQSAVERGYTRGERLGPYVVWRPTPEDARGAANP